MDESPQQPSRSLRTATTGALVFLWLIVVTGATVRLTGSGLGCPDWPTCTGARPIPEAEFHGVIEFTNRMVSLPTTIFVVWAVWLSRKKHVPDRPDIRLGTWGALIGVIANIVLGAFLIKLELAPELVSTHFIVTIWTLFAATLAWIAAKSPRRLRLLRDRTAPYIGSFVLLSIAALTILAGVLTTASGPHSGSTDPSIGVDRLGIASLAVTFHARLAYVFAAVVIIITVWLRRNRAGLRDVLILALLVTIQIALGEYQFRNGLPWEVVLAHVSTASALWIVTCKIAIDAGTGNRSDIRKLEDDPT
jgi:cytochrome c oxidase assembly protein subunit 15